VSYLCGGAGGETQTTGKCRSEDKATDFEATDEFHDESLFSFKREDGAARLARAIPVF
jgi:hypothetical protein